MAKSKTNDTIEKTATPTKNTGRQIRLAFGTFVLILGTFLSLSIISYFFTWQQDQDKILNLNSTWDFIKNKNQIFHNIGGRLGALCSHVLVYNYVGILALAISLWIALLGLYLVYDKKVIKLAKYLRWICFALLISAPILSFLFPDSEFPWGGAWGNESILFLNGLIGKMGTALVLFSLLILSIFIVFSLDIRPLLSKAKRNANQLGNQLNNAITKPTQQIEDDTITNIEEALTKKEIDKTGNGIKVENTNDTIEGYAGAQAYETPLNATIKTREPLQETIISETQIPNPPIPSKLQIDEALDIEEDTDSDENLDDDNDLNNLSFEVKTVEEETLIKEPNGAAITVQDKEPYAPELDLSDYKFPTLDLLEDRTQEGISINKEELESNKEQIIKTLKSFGIEIQKISATVGPTVTLYEIIPVEGVRISKIRNLEDDIALSLSALGIRIIAPIPGKGTIGIEVPNANKQIVSMKALLNSEKFIHSKMSLPIALGKKIDNENYIVDLATMPHLLMAGATGQGKSVGINAILVSLLYKKHPSQLKFVLVDPKKVELSIYNKIEKHFLAKLPHEEEAIITDTKKVINTLNALCIEMDNRYELLKAAGTRNIKEYNEKFIHRRLNPEKGHQYLPFIVLVVDEFADLIMTAGKEVEMPIARLAQLARAVGIHLIVATQRPSVNVITGTIKANFPARIAFKVSAKVDSRTILDSGGAEQLVGRGDMLISHGSEIIRLQCAFVDTPEVEEIVNFIGDQRGYPAAFELPEYEADESGPSKNLEIGNRDELFEECARLIVQTQSGSTSNLQRKLNLGYNRAGRIMDQIEAAGIVGPASGSKPREVYVKTEAELEAYL